MTAAKGTMSQPKNYKMIVEKDVWIPLRDGTRVFCCTAHRDAGPRSAG